MKLLVIRHAIAEYEGSMTPDPKRALSSKGKKIFHRLCKQIQFLDLKYDLLLTSPFLRSKQTADIFSMYFSAAATQESKNLKPSADTESFLIYLSATGLNSVAIIGHQPFLNQLISLCLSSDTREFLILKRGAMAFLEFPLIVKKHSAILKSLLDPQYLIKKETFSP